MSNYNTALKFEKPKKRKNSSKYVELINSSKMIINYNGSSEAYKRITGAAYSFAKSNGFSISISKTDAKTLLIKRVSSPNKIVALLPEKGLAAMAGKSQKALNTGDSISFVRKYSKARGAQYQANYESLTKINQGFYLSLNDHSSQSISGMAAYQNSLMVKEDKTRRYGASRFDENGYIVYLKSL